MYSLNSMIHLACTVLQSYWTTRKRSDKSVFNQFRIVMITVLIDLNISVRKFSSIKSWKNKENWRMN